MAERDDRERALPVLDPATLDAGKAEPDSSATAPDSAGDARVGGLLLAAGTSDRYGEANKLLASAAGDPVVWHAARTLCVAPVSPVTVVVGHEADRVRDALDGLAVETVDVAGTGATAEPIDGEPALSASLRRGIAALPDVDAVVIALGDMPAVAPASVRALVRAYRAGAGSALAAAHEGVRGNPVLFDRRHFDRLAAVDGDRGGRAVLRDTPDAALVETGDPGVLADVDRPDDLRRVAALLADRAE